jgi:glycosyltransferase involved in cell wall biosynthesis
MTPDNAAPARPGVWSGDRRDSRTPDRRSGAPPLAPTSARGSRSIRAVPDLPLSSTAERPPAADLAPPPLRIALVGTRGVPAQYGGFETAVEEVGSRLAARGHHITVYCRSRTGRGPDEHLGMHLVQLPAVRTKALETLTHTAASTAHLLLRQQQDVVILFNAANAPLLPLLQSRGVPVATHMDGLEWKRAKWGHAGRRYYRMAESMAVRWSDALIADARGIADYYQQQFCAATTLIPYGAPLLIDPPSHRLAELDVQPSRFHVVVARFEPENHVDLALQGYTRSGARHPLLVVGSAPYADRYTQRIRSLAAQDSRIRLVGAVWDQELLDQLYAHALTYVHGHSVGGTNPSLLRAMGAGTAALAYDVVFNREVLGADGLFFRDADDLSHLIDLAEAHPDDLACRGARLRGRAAEVYRWDDVADRYERLCTALASGLLSNTAMTGRRVAAR